MTCKLYNGRVLVIFLVIFALPRQTPIGPDLFTDTVTVWRDHRHASAGWPSSCNGLASTATHPGVRTWEASQEAGPRSWPPPQDTRGWGYFGCSGRSRSVPLVGLRSGVPGAF
jgi:hypothetical protein